MCKGLGDPKWKMNRCIQEKLKKKSPRKWYTNFESWEVLQQQRSLQNQKRICPLSQSSVRLAYRQDRRETQMGKQGKADFIIPYREKDVTELMRVGSLVSSRQRLPQVELSHKATLQQIRRSWGINFQTLLCPKPWLPKQQGVISFYLGFGMNIQMEELY